MSMWTGASDELTQYLAQREVERQRELVNRTAREDRVYRRGRDVIADKRADAAEQRAAAESQLAADREQRIQDDADENRRFRIAQVEHQAGQPGNITGDASAYNRQHEFGMAGDTFKKIALPVATFARPARPGANEGDLATLATESKVDMGPAYQSLGGTEYQQKQRDAEARAVAAAVAAQDRADRAKEHEEFVAGQNAQNRALTGAIAAQSNATRQAAVDARAEREHDKPATAAERQVMAFYNRANAAHEVLTTPDKSGKTLEDQIAGQGVVGQLRGASRTPNILQTNDQQVYRQAQRQFAEALLRRESGAAISQSEQDLVNQQYFAVPGDSPATVQLKQRAREQVVDGMKFGAGKAYREYYGDDPARLAAPAGTPKVTLKPGASLGADWGK